MQMIRLFLERNTIISILFRVSVDAYPETERVPHMRDSLIKYRLNVKLISFC